MSVPALEPLSGMRIATAAIGDAYGGRPNLLLAAFGPDTTVAGMLTRSSTAAAPVRWTRARLAERAPPRALVVNAGNANCFTGAEGDAAVRHVAARVAEIVGCAADEVYLASTGRIGQPLDLEAYDAALDRAGAALDENRWNDVARSIMTTDRRPKAALRQATIGDDTVRLQGVTKGNTMIAPHMATTLSFLFTDACLPATALQPLLAHATAESFERISVDNTQSTNDTILLFATGGAPRPARSLAADDPMLADFRAAVHEMLSELAGLIIEDAGHGGVIMRISVRGAASESAAAHMARAIADSYLVRRDVARGHELMPGRIVAALGMAEEAVDPAGLTLALGGQVLTRNGGLAGSAVIDARPYIRNGRLDIEIDAAVGDASAVILSVAF